MGVQARFLLGPAGSGKTFRCLAEIRAELIAAPEGAPLILLAPKQATFQLERQLLADPALQGYTRLRILSFERLAQFVFDELRVSPPDALSEEGRVMVLRALLIQRQSELKIFRASARRTGFARELSLLLRVFQRHQLSPNRLDALAQKPRASTKLRDKIQDLALLLRAYGDWLKQHGLQDANHLLDVAAEALRDRAKTEAGELKIAGLWLDGFAEMTPQEIDLLATLLPRCERATLAFCLDPDRAGETSWLSPWSVVSQTSSRCRARLESLPGVEVVTEALERDSRESRFAGSSLLRHLESRWEHPIPQPAGRKPQPGPGIRLVACANPEAEAAFAAREILRFVRAGGRFRDCAVIVRSLELCHATLARGFRRYGIPFFLDRRESVAHHPLAELTRCALRTVALGWQHEDWFGALKSGFALVREDDLDGLENAALQFGWQGNGWRHPFPAPVNASLAERSEPLRQKIVPPFAELAQQAAAPLTGPKLADAIRRLWTQLEVEPTLERWNATTPLEIHASVWEQMNDWLGILALAFARESLPVRDWLPILDAGLANLTVGVIPLALDQVLIGAIDRSRNPDLKLALVLGVNEGVFPALPPSGGLLTNTDRTALEQEDVYLGPTVLQHLGLERYYGYIACTRASERLVLTRAMQGADGQLLNASPLFEHVRQIAGVAEEKFPGTEDWRQSEHVCEVEALVLRTLAAASESAPLDEPPAPLEPVGAAAPAASSGRVPLPEGTRGGTRSEPAVEDARATDLKRLSPERMAMVRGDRWHPTSESEALLQLSGWPALEPVVQKWHQWTDAASRRRLSVPMAEKLYGPELQTSVSALEDFAACPFKYLAARGLRLEERKEFRFDDRDKGSFQHEVLREFHERVRTTGRSWRQLSVVEARVMVTNLAHDLLGHFEHGKFQADGAARFMGGLLIERLGDLVETLIEWMAQYEFDPVLAEIGFGLEAEGLPAWRLELPDRRALCLRGRMDRVDLHRRDDDTALAVVMDYKSSARKLNPTKLHFGLELQLLSYLGVLQQLVNPEKIFGVKKLLPVGAFYVPLNGGGTRSGATRSEMVAADPAERRTAYQHRGRFLADVLELLDNRDETKGDQFKYSRKQAGGLAARGNEAIPQAEFESLREKIARHLRDYGQRILAGEVEVSPFRLGQQTACERCDFRAVCRFDPWTQPYRNLRLPESA